MLRPIACGLLLVAVTQAAADGARVYRSVDRDGHVHYSDQPSGNSVAVDPRVAPATGASTPAPKLNAEECERRRKEADSYRSAGKITETSPLGETREYSEAERLKLVERADQLAGKACGDVPQGPGSE